MLNFLNSSTSSRPLPPSLLSLYDDGQGYVNSLYSLLDRTIVLDQVIRRSETTRGAELSDFESIPLTIEGPEDAFAVIMRQRGGKTKDRKDGSTDRKTHYHAQEHFYLPCGCSCTVVFL